MEMDPDQLDYTLSVFGDIDYLHMDKIELVLPDPKNKYGCEDLYK